MINLAKIHQFCSYNHFFFAFYKIDTQMYFYTCMYYFGHFDAGMLV